MTLGDLLKILFKDFNGVYKWWIYIFQGLSLKMFFKDLPAGNRKFLGIFVQSLPRQPNFLKDIQSKILFFLFFKQRMIEYSWVNNKWYIFLIFSRTLLFKKKIIQGLQLYIKIVNVYFSRTFFKNDFQGHSV